MSKVSDIIVQWRPEESGRVVSAQIRSRIVGTEDWTEQAAAADPKSGTFRFTSNAPGSDVEVQMRYRMIEGVFSPWCDGTVHTDDVVIAYVDLSGTPSSLHDINPDEGTHLDGIEPGATVGAPAGTMVSGVPATMVVANLTSATSGLAITNSTIATVQAAVDAANTTIATNRAAAQADLNTARSDLSAATASVALDLASARTSLTTAVTDAQTTAANALTISQSNFDIATTASAAAQAAAGVASSAASSAQSQSSAADLAKQAAQSFAATADTAKALALTAQSDAQV